MEKRKAFLVNTAYYGLIAALVVLFLKYGLRYVLPFVLGFLIAYACQKPIRAISRKWKLNQKVSSIIVLALVMVLMAGISLLFIVKLSGGLVSLFRQLPAFYASQVEPYLQRILQWYENTDLVEILGETVAALLETVANNVLSTVGTWVTRLSVWVVSLLSGIITRFPSFLMTFLITIISAFFISFDYDRIVNFISLQMKPRTRELVSYVCVNLMGIIGKYLISYSLILLITFAELMVITLVAGIENAFLISLLIALFDFMPIVGISTVFVPWIIIDLVAGRYVQAIILGAGWVIMTVVRNIIEPRIVGQKVGLHPVVTLVAMYVGLKAAGLIGMLALPVTLVMLNEMQKKDIIHFYKEEPRAVEEES